MGRRHGDLQLRQPEAQRAGVGPAGRRIADPDLHRRRGLAIEPDRIAGRNVHYGYSATRPSRIAQVQLPNGATLDNTCDALARLTNSVLKTGGGTTLNAHAYAYNQAHQRTRQTRVGGDYVDYAYDPIGHLTSALGDPIDRVDPLGLFNPSKVVSLCACERRPGEDTRRIIPGTDSARPLPHS